ncbi:MAG: hypothetical protein STHCBS139747_007154 [Sporothrix thermara]
MASNEVKSVREAVHQSPPIDPKAPYDTASVAGKTILITGGASGFGAAFARRWASLGAHVAIGDINDADGEALVAELRASTSGGKYHHYVHCDVTSWESQAAFFRAAVAHSADQCVHVVVPNAGINTPGNQRRFEEPAPADPANESQGPAAPRMPVIDVNITGMLYTTYLALYWLPRNNGRDRHILFLSSIAGLIGLPGQPHYAMSKHAVTGLFRSLRGSAHLHPGLRVNMLCPYFVATAMLPNTGRALLAGSGLATVADVVEAGTRFVADEAVAGRALVVGPKMLLKSSSGDTDDSSGFDVITSPEGSIQVVGVPTEAQVAAGKDQAIWECYADDLDTCETFVYRYVRLLNLLTTARGWFGFFGDLYNIYVKGQKTPSRQKKQA